MIFLNRASGLKAQVCHTSPSLPPPHSKKAARASVLPLHGLALFETTIWPNSFEDVNEFCSEICGIDLSPKVAWLAQGRGGEQASYIICNTLLCKTLYSQHQNTEPKVKWTSPREKQNSSCMMQSAQSGYMGLSAWGSAAVCRRESVAYCSAITRLPGAAYYAMPCAAHCTAQSYQSKHSVNSHLCWTKLATITTVAGRPTLEWSYPQLEESWTRSFIMRPLFSQRHKSQWSKRKLRWIEDAGHIRNE